MAAAVAPDPYPRPRSAGGVYTGPIRATPNVTGWRAAIAQAVPAVSIHSQKRERCSARSTNVSTSNPGGSAPNISTAAGSYQPTSTSRSSSVASLAVPAGLTGSVSTSSRCSRSSMRDTGGRPQASRAGANISTTGTGPPSADTGPNAAMAPAKSSGSDQPTVTVMGACACDRTASTLGSPTGWAHQPSASGLASPAITLLNTVLRTGSAASNGSTSAVIAAASVVVCSRIT